MIKVEILSDFFVLNGLFLPLFSALTVYLYAYPAEKRTSHLNLTIPLQKRLSQMHLRQPYFAQIILPFCVFYTVNLSQGAKKCDKKRGTYIKISYTEEIPTAYRPVRQRAFGIFLFVIKLKCSYILTNWRLI